MIGELIKIDQSTSTRSTMQSLHRAVSRLHPRRNSKHSKRLGFPPEVWLAIFENGDLSIDDISNVRLTCSLFAALAKLQAFSTFHFHPFIFVPSMHHGHRLAFAQEHIDRRLKRLEYWASPDIAPLVRECKVDPIHYGDPHYPTDQRKDPAFLIDAFFQTLSQFCNLHHLGFQHIPFSDQALGHLCGLKELRSFAVSDCIVTASAAPRPLLKVADVQFVSLWTHEGVDERGSVGWLDILNPDTIRRILIRFHKPRILHLRGIATRRSLYDLSLPEVDNVNRHIISILSHPSALQELHIDHYTDRSTTSVSDPPSTFEVGSFSLPSLRLYHGPHEYLSWFETGPSLHTVAFIVSTHQLYVSALAVQHTLEQQHVSGSIRSLEFCVSHIPDSLLMTICSRFTHLTDLIMSAKKVNEDQLITTVKTSLPPKIETVTLDIWYLGSNMTRVGWIKRGLPLRRNLFNNYPTLRRAKCTLFRTYIGFDWRRSDPVSHWKIVRIVKSVAYVCGLRSEA